MNALPEGGFFESRADGIGAGKTMVMDEDDFNAMRGAASRGLITRVPAANGQGMAPLWAAMAKAQGGYGQVIAMHKVTITPREKPAYSFYYADLEEILSKTRKALSDNGLTFIQLPTGSEVDGVKLTSILAHESGASLESEITIPASGDIKEFGGYITYVRRYIAAPMLGVSSTELMEHDGSAPGDGTGEDAPGQRDTMETHPELAKCTTLQELTSVMNKIQPATERRKWVPYYTKRQRDLADSTKAAG